MAFQQGLSGLNASSEQLDVIGNNIANANTYGAKSSAAVFGDMYASALGGGGGTGNSVGIGVNVEAVEQNFSQGNITTTGNNLDLAINGGGFFALQNAQGDTVYSRNGQFQRNTNGYIVNATGDELLGQALSSTGQASGPNGVPIQLSNNPLPPQAASAVSMTANLDAAATPPTVTPVDFSNSSSYNFVTSQTLYGVNGSPVNVNYYFVESAAPTTTAGGSWNVYMSAGGNTNADSVSTDGSGNPTPVASFTFNSNGTLPSGSTFTLPNIPGGANGSTINGVTLNLAGTTEYAGGFSVTSLTGGGYAAGNLSSYTIGNDGTIKAEYTNGETADVARVQLTNFENLNGLKPVGNNEWQATNTSGNPLPLGTPGTGVYGVLQSGALEDSNVDLTGSLVNMIVAQRAYQANAQTIKTEDTLMQTLVSLQ